MKPEAISDPAWRNRWGVRAGLGTWVLAEPLFTNRRINFTHRHDACRWIDRHQERLRQQAIDTLREWTP